MIATRGPNEIAVVERTGAPVVEVCHSIIDSDFITEIQEKYAITYSEFVESVAWYYECYGPSDLDFIELAFDGFSIEAVGLSSWFCVASVFKGITRDSGETDSLKKLFSNGLTHLMMDSFEAYLNDREWPSSAHQILFDAFQAVYGEIDYLEAHKLLSDLEEAFDG
jgi:hypothetical protein